MGMKGLILAGVKDPAPAYDFDHEQAHGVILNRPMILIRSRPRGTRRTDVMIVTGGEHIGSIAEFLGDGTEYGVRLLPRKDAGGIAQALGLAKDFVGNDRIGHSATTFTKTKTPRRAACRSRNRPRHAVFGGQRPQRFGVAAVENGIITGIEEKPAKPKATMRSPASICTRRTCSISYRALSLRGELELSVNNCTSSATRVRITFSKDFGQTPARATR